MGIGAWPCQGTVRTGSAVRCERAMRAGVRRARCVFHDYDRDLLYKIAWRAPMRKDV
jgi:hypothetical protein